MPYKSIKGEWCIFVKPVRMSLALQEAVPMALEAVQVYCPPRLISVCEICRTATLFKYDICTLYPSLICAPSLYQVTSIGSEPLMPQSNVIGKPTVSWMSLNFRENEGGSLRSARKQILCRVIDSEWFGFEFGHYWRK